MHPVNQTFREVQKLKRQNGHTTYTCLQPQFKRKQSSRSSGGSTDENMTTLWMDVNMAMSHGFSELNVHRKLLPEWSRLRDLSLPPSARCWKLDGSPSSPGFWQSPEGSATLDGASLTRRRSSTVSPVIWRCKHVKQRPGILPVPVWRKVSSQTSQRKPDLS